MASKNPKHIHKYHQIKLSYATVWACALPDCRHYLPVHSEALINGKRSLCWNCGEDFILDPLSMEMIQPECANCRLGIATPEPKISEELQKTLDEFVEKT